MPLLSTFQKRKKCCFLGYLNVRPFSLWAVILENVLYAEKKHAAQQ